MRDLDFRSLPSRQSIALVLWVATTAGLAGAARPLPDLMLEPSARFVHRYQELRSGRVWKVVEATSDAPEAAPLVVTVPRPPETISGWDQSSSEITCAFVATVHDGTVRDDRTTDFPFEVSVVPAVPGSSAFEIVTTIYDCRPLCALAACPEIENSVHAFNVRNLAQRLTDRVVEAAQPEGSIGTCAGASPCAVAPTALSLDAVPFLNASGLTFQQWRGGNVGARHLVRADVTPRGPMVAFYYRVASEIVPCAGGFCITGPEPGSDEGEPDAGKIPIEELIPRICTLIRSGDGSGGVGDCPWCRAGRCPAWELYFPDIGPYDVSLMPGRGEKPLARPTKVKGGGMRLLLPSELIGAPSQDGTKPYLRISAPKSEAMPASLRFEVRFTTER